jgi:hypothetical protein
MSSSECRHRVGERRDDPGFLALQQNPQQLPSARVAGVDPRLGQIRLARNRFHARGRVPVGNDQPLRRVQDLIAPRVDRHSRLALPRRFRHQ